MKLKKKTKRKSAKDEVTTMPLNALLMFRVREGGLIFAFALSLFLLIALASYHHADPGWSHVASVLSVHNLGGRMGAWMADFLLYFFGYVAYLLVLSISYATILFYKHRHKDEVVHFRYVLIGVKLFGLLLLLLSLAALIAIFFHPPAYHLPSYSGGIIGQSISHFLLGLLNKVGASLLLVTLSLVGVTLFSGCSWLQMIEGLGAATLSAASWSYYNLRQIDLSWFQQRYYTMSSYLQQCKEIMSQLTLKLPRRKTSLREPELEKSCKLNQSSIDLSISPPASPQEPIVRNKKPQVSSPIKAPRHKKGSLIPNLNLLDKPEKTVKQDLTMAQLQEKGVEVEQKLKDFSVDVKVVTIHPGPVVTRYELSLAAGTKVSKITGLAKDLARSLSVVSVRVVEVIPGKSVIGIELPNKKREMVTLQEVLSSKQYRDASSSLSLALGKDIAGHPVVVDLAKMPHLLVAGTTGSGKSVNLNAMLLSLLYKSTPEQLRLIMIDPKMLELAIYDGIPHLLTPVVTDMKQAATALRWCVMEMERRYRLMASLGVRNIAGYNQKVRAARKKGAPLLDPLLKPEEGEAAELTELPRIVILADEFADMMVVVGKKVETLISRLAQKARAAGVHLIFATQRPSVDVITGLIKANIPTRIAFQVSSKIDSRTILDQQGAEQLLGHGDMLYLPPGSGLPVRVHGAYVGDDEVHRVVAYLKAQSEPEYIEALRDENLVVDPTGYTQASEQGESAENDEYYDEAVKFVTQSRKASISSVQRRFRIGYNRAASIVEAMEAAGVVSRVEGSGMREVLAPPPRD